MKKFRVQSWWILLSFLALGLGFVLRFWNITNNQFLFYDEGMYLGYNRKFLDLVALNLPKDIHELFIILGVMFKTALGTAKALWFFLLNLRVFILGADSLYFARLVSAISGIATIALTYVFANRYFKSKTIALLSAVLLSLLPSHVFYSRLGMQESFSTLLFLAALYVYLFYRSKNWSAPVAALLLSCVFLTNYRMIIGPIFIITIEIFESWKNREAINWKRLAICLGVFSAIVFIIGSLYGGINRYVTFGWMFHQAQESQDKRSLINLLSYPYYVFVLEGFLFALIFWSNIYLIVKKQWFKVLPFILVLLQMGIFSFAAEKGARYLCVVLPLMAIAAAVVVDFFINLFHKKTYLAAAVVLACLLMGIESLKIAGIQTDYDKAVAVILKNDPNAGILSTQSLVEQLYVKDENRIRECPKNLSDFVVLYQAGYHYLILDPQAYISWTRDTQRFSPPLIDFLESIHKYVSPLVVLKHFNSLTLKRFVLDHNQNLSQSIKFLNVAEEEGFGQIRIYDIGQSLIFFKQQASQVSEEKYKSKGI